VADSTRTKPAILFTAFEPSGDAHAAPVIRELLAMVPGLTVYAWGGPLMEAAGATIIERTAEDGAMGAGALKRVMQVKRQIRQIKRWSTQYRVLAHVAVDSPAANFPIAKHLRKSGARIIHLVAPQIWAWGGWRIGKLRKLTSLVLCLLPFEEQWFRDRDVPARFIGHPVINCSAEDDLSDKMHGLPSGAPRVVILPGSRSQEVSANIRLLVGAYSELQGRHSGMGGVIVAASPEMAAIVRRKAKVFPHGLHMITGDPDPVIAWADLALAVSGTVTLDIARQHTPMVGIYKTGLVSWIGAKIIVRTPFRLLPNIIAEREIVPEFVPYIGGSMAIARAASPYLLDSKAAAVQAEELKRVCLRFAGKRPAKEAATLIIKVIKGAEIQ
jgi:lipid-A-disaccharide synthase